MSPLTEPTRLRLANGQPVANDPYFYTNTVLLLHGNGTNGSTTITDSSPSPKTVTAVGNAQISTAQSKFGGSSIAFDGTNDYITVPATGTPGDLGSGNFTVETWIYLVARTQLYPGIVNNYSTFATGSFGLFAGHNSATITKFQLALNGTGFPSIDAGTINYGQWDHLAVVRDSGVIRLYQNGVSVGSVSFSGALSGTTGSLWIGRAGDWSSSAKTDLNAFIDEFRITKGVARYTANFTPPTAPFPDF